MPRQQFILCLLATCLATRLCATIESWCQEFNAVDNAHLCIRSQYIRSKPNVRTEATCALLCTVEPLCQAFAIPVAVGSCQLFVFDRCSVRVRECGDCTTRGRVFVRRQPGLPPGALCQSDYGDDLCGTKYRLYPDIQYWEPSRQRCASDSGLVIMADVVDATEMTHIDMLCNRSSNGTFLGGFQPAGSQEPAGGWIWIDCGTPVSPSLWSAGEPNNNDNYGQNVVGRWFNYPKLADLWDYTFSARGVLCECVSPFN